MDIYVKIFKSMLLGELIIKINTYFIQLSLTIIVIFGGTLVIRYFRTNEILVDQLIGASVGVLLLIASLIWRRIKK